jgi:hypothetical protein
VFACGHQRVIIKLHGQRTVGKTGEFSFRFSVSKFHVQTNEQPVAAWKTNPSQRLLTQKEITSVPV